MFVPHKEHPVSQKMTDDKIVTNMISGYTAETGATQRKDPKEYDSPYLIPKNNTEVVVSNWYTQIYVLLFGAPTDCNR
jgi:hypothetical protein